MDEIVVDEPPPVQDAIVDINREARDRTLQVALLIPLVAAIVGVFGGFRMVRLPDIEPTANVEGVV